MFEKPEPQNFKRTALPENEVTSQLLNSIMYELSVRRELQHHRKKEKNFYSVPL